MCKMRKILRQIKLRGVRGVKQMQAGAENEYKKKNTEREREREKDSLSSMQLVTAC